jgi:hypothetical protein
MVSTIKHMRACQWLTVMRYAGIASALPLRERCRYVLGMVAEQERRNGNERVNVLQLACNTETNARNGANKKVIPSLKWELKAGLISNDQVMIGRPLRNHNQKLRGLGPCYQTVVTVSRWASVPLRLRRP